MHALCVVLALAACKGKGDDAPPPAKRDAAAIEIDWTRCATTIGTFDDVLSGGAVARLLQDCRVCGDWLPILDWNRPQQDGGPTRQQIVDAMDRCRAFCDSTAKTYFMGTLDAARGTDSRQPWSELGKQCKAAVSAVPDTRFMSAPFFALDRIARAIAAHGGEIAKRAAKLELPLPAVSLTGVGVELPAVQLPSLPRWIDARCRAVTVLGEQILVGDLPRARFGSNGLAIDYGATPYPGSAIDLHLATAKPLWFKGVPRVAVFAAKQAKAAPIVDIIAEAALTKTDVYLAIDSGGGPGFTVPALIPTRLVSGDDIALDDAATVQDLATAIAKLDKLHVGIRRKAS